MSLVCALLFAAFASTFALEDENALKSEWEAYKKSYNKSYSSDNEDRQRYQIFLETREYVNEHNKQYENGASSYSLKVNAFADMTPEERVKLASCVRIDDGTQGSPYVPPDDIDVASLPKSVDWRKNGYVTPVRAQGVKCGSCYAFASMAALESYHIKKTGKVVILSPQNIVDCTIRMGNHGCHNGSVTTAFKYVIKNKGVDTEKSYPYAEKVGPCKFKKSGVGATMKSFVNIRHESEKDLMIAVATAGPVVVGLAADNKGFLTYDKGIIHEKCCPGKIITHSALVVGYGETKGEKYWIVKNSWGDDWGMKGYAFIARDQKNTCLIASSAIYPVV